MPHAEIPECDAHHCRARAACPTLIIRMHDPKEGIMTPLLIIIGIAAVTLLLRPVARTQVVYVPLEVAEQPRGLGCLPLIVGGILVLLVLLALGGVPV